MAAARSACGSGAISLSATDSKPVEQRDVAQLFGTIDEERIPSSSQFARADGKEC